MEWPPDFQVSVVLVLYDQEQEVALEYPWVIVEIYSYRLSLDREIQRAVGERSKDRAREEIWKTKRGTEFMAKIVGLHLIVELIHDKSFSVIYCETLGLYY
jgi:hypothetical protein